MRDISIRAAVTGEWGFVVRLLEQTGLGAAEVDLVGTTFHIAVAEHVIAGCAGTKRHGGAAVFGPLAVLPEYRERGIGSHLVQAALMRARAGGCQQAVVLSMFCASFFSRHGFLVTPRGALPRELRASKAYQRHDSQASFCMTCDLTQVSHNWVPPSSY
ncbi:GNAT family N-acetyltransferase [Cupriavidus necator]